MPPGGYQPAGPTSKGASVSAAGSINPKSAAIDSGVACPADGDHRAGEEILEHQAPADDPRRQLAERGICIRVSAAGYRNDRRELGIAQARERARNAREYEGQHDSRPRMLRGDDAVSTKMPAPIVLPTPKQVRLNMPSVRGNGEDAGSRTSISMGWRANSRLRKLIGSARARVARRWPCLRSRRARRSRTLSRCLPAAQSVRQTSPYR